ncbi:hypothetical protein [Bradyrhizobium sp. STM 3557]|uniref:hypothetical protein n=1 Tax=Bradyrhizobium sp. STM 3557 TaxID=578920 RepID=UPI00388E3D34
MRISVVFVAVMVIAAPVPASAACMSISEARQHFGSVHLYWHGSDHCWDASPGRRREAAATQRHARGHERPEPRRPKWREARSELVADNGPVPVRASQDMADQPVATPDAPPVKVLPVKLVSILSDWTERWVDVEQVDPERLIKAQSMSRPAPASDHKIDATLVVHGLALFAFGFGLVLTFVALVMRSGASSIGPPSAAEESSYPAQTDSEDVATTLQGSPAALPPLVARGGRRLASVRHLILVLISRQAHLICWKALRWGRHIDRFVSNGAYPTEVKWPPYSAGAMISSEDIPRPFTIPSRLLEETRQAASRAVSPPLLPKPRIRPG